MATLLTEDPEFETEVIRTVLSDHGLFLGCEAALKPEYLLDASSQMLWGMAQDYYRTYRSIPNRTILRDQVLVAFAVSNDREKRQRQTLLDHIEVICKPPSASAAYVAARLSQFLQGKALQEAVVATLDDLQANKIDAALIDRFKVALQAGTKKTDPGSLVIGSTEEMVRKETDPRWRPAIPTGLVHFDAEIGGGPREGDLCMLMAPPKGYKSGTMLNFAFNGVKRGVGVNTLYVTLELSEHLQLLRFAVRTTMKTKHDMLRNPGGFVDYWNVRVKNIFQPGKNIYIKYFDAYKFTPKTLDDYLEMMQREHGVTFGLVIIDYLNLVGSDAKKEKDYLEKVIIATDLRSIAQKWKFPLWTAARSNREEQSSSRPGMKHMAASFEWVGICDMCYALRRYKKEGTLHLIPIASRNESGSKRIICRCDPAYMYLSSIGAEDMPEEDDEEDNPRKRKRQDDEDGVEETAREIRKARKKEKQ